MIPLPPISTRTDTLFPYTTLFRSGRDILNTVLLPQAAGVAKGVNAAFGRNARAGQDDDILDRGHTNSVRPELVEGPFFLQSGGSARTALRQAQGERGIGVMTSIGIIGSEGRMGVALSAAISAAGERSCGVDKRS